MVSNLNNCNILNPSRISFGARKKEIKEADKILRKTKNTFPMLSQTMAEDTYHCLKYNSKNKEKASLITDKMYENIMSIRTLAELNRFNPKIPAFDRETLYALNLSGVKALKLGNCKENAMAAVAILCANGYYNSDRAELFYKVDIVDKNTDKKVREEEFSLDHSFAITDMNKGGKQNVVIDPWLGFADYKEGAVARFKQIYSKRDLDVHKNYARNIFCCDRRINLEQFDENYKINTSFTFKKMEQSATTEDKERLGSYTRVIYDGKIT